MVGPAGWITSWLVTMMTAMVLGGGPAGTGPGGVLALAIGPPPAVEVSPTEGKAPVGGFRMEGAARVDVVFAGSDHFRQRIDHFYALAGALDGVRQSLSRSVQAALTALAAAPRRRCPEKMLAPLYANVDELLLRFDDLGRDLEAEHRAMAQLARSGALAGLGVADRRRVSESAAIYRRALTDREELRAAASQLFAAIARHGCRKRQLRARADGDSAQAENLAATDLARAPVLRRRQHRARRRAHRRDQEPSPPPALPVTFFIDNRACESAVAVIVDGEPAGKVAARAKAAFQTLAGRHTLCLLSDGSEARCGQPGTVRTGFLHDGWSMTLRCAAGQPSGK